MPVGTRSRAVMECVDCGRRLALAMFGREKRNRNGRNRRCRTCNSVCRERSRNTEMGQVSRLVQRSRRNSRARGARDPARGVNRIDNDFVFQQLRAQDYKCYYSALPLSFVTKDMHQASLERLDDTQGYVPENTVIVCKMFNIGQGRTMSRRKFRHVVGHRDHPFTAAEYRAQMKHIRAFASSAYHGARGSCKQRNRTRPHERHEVTVTQQDLVDLVWAQRGLCAYSDVRMSFEIGSPDWMVSLERMDPRKGYTRDNVVLVCLEFNTMVQLTRERVQSWRGVGGAEMLTRARTRKRRRDNDVETSAASGRAGKVQCSGRGR